MECVEGKMMSDWQMGATRHWLNLGVLLLCLEEVSLIRKISIITENKICGLEIVCNGKATELGYHKEEDRDQAYEAIWAALEKMAG